MADIHHFIYGSCNHLLFVLLFASNGLHTSIKTQYKEYGYHLRPTTSRKKDFLENVVISVIQCLSRKRDIANALTKQNLAFDKVLNQTIVFGTLQYVFTSKQSGLNLPPNWRTPKMSRIGYIQDNLSLKSICLTRPLLLPFTTFFYTLCTSYFASATVAQPVSTTPLPRSVQLSYQCSALMFQWTVQFHIARHNPRSLFYHHQLEIHDPL